LYTSESEYEPLSELELLCYGLRFIVSVVVQALRKYKDASAQLTKQAMTISDQSIQISRLESLNRVLKESVTELTRKLDAEKRNTLQITDLETKGELDSLEQLRLEVILLLQANLHAFYLM